MTPQIVRVICEEGITLVPGDGTWFALHGDWGRSLAIGNGEEFLSRSGLRPIVISERLGSNEASDRLLRFSNRASFGISISEMVQQSLRVFPSFPACPGSHKALNVIYLLQALQYHCIQLCVHYSSICRSYSSIPIEPADRGHHGNFGMGSEPYFEFDALITAIRRTYDALRYLIWQFFGPKQGSLPTSLYKTVPLCESLPESLAALLSESWSSYGEEITTYRNCVQHYSPVNTQLSFIRMQKRDPGIWGAQVLIPDNPSAKSKARFSYAESRDALTYCWRAADEILRVSIAVLEAVHIDDAQRAVPADVPQAPRR